MIKAVVFDLDNTLIDRNQSFQRFCDYYIDKYADTYPYKGTRENLVRTMIKIDANGYGGLENMLPKLKPIWTLPLSTKEFIEERNHIFGKLSVPMPDLYKVLETLKKKYKLGIITNGYSFVQREKITTVGIEDYFDDIIVSGEHPFAKPDPRIFQLSCSHLGMKPEEMYYVGDYYPNDIAGAMGAKIEPIWITEEPDEHSEFYKLYQTYQGIRIRELNELLELL